MDDFVANAPNELILACFDHLLSTSAARLHEGKDHIFYAIQPSLCRVNRAFALNLGSRFKHAKFVRVRYAASEELSPERFIPVVSISAINLNDLSRTDKKDSSCCQTSVFVPKPETAEPRLKTQEAPTQSYR